MWSTRCRPASVSTSRAVISSTVESSSRSRSACVRTVSPGTNAVTVNGTPINVESSQTPTDAATGTSVDINAEVTRYSRMTSWADAFPEYKLAAHKGYATPEHLEALDRHGVTPLHRRSFAPVAYRSLYPSERPAENLELFPDDEL